MEILLWLFVINLGIAFGAGLYESRITVPQWLRHSPGSGYRWDAEAARQMDVGLKFWAYVTTLPLSLLTLASLVAPWWVAEAARQWWLAAALFALVERLMTGAYFIPTMIKLTGDEPPPDAVPRAMLWVKLGYVRLALTLNAWLAALKALTLLYAQGG